MATTPNRKIIKLESNLRQPELPINEAEENFDKRDGYVAYDVAGSVATIPMDESIQLYGFIKLTGVRTAALTLKIDLTLGFSRPIIFWNATTGGYTVTVKTTASGTPVGVALPPGEIAMLTHDGTDVISLSGGVPTWTAPTLLNSWANFGGVNAPAGYYKRGGRVYLRGLIAGGTIGATAFTLPVGYRPAYYHYFATVTYNYVFGSGYIKDNGEVFIHDGNNTFFSLDNISFAVS
ncbi:MAG TPA: hypothetical protein VF735_06555 [Pyrinomonadaceae bacterium]|jgi:hypothetical protein